MVGIGRNQALERRNENQFVRGTGILLLTKMGQDPRRLLLASLHTFDADLNRLESLIEAEGNLDHHTKRQNAIFFRPFP